MAAEGRLYALIFAILYRGLEHPQDFGICGVLESSPLGTEGQLCS